MTHYDEAQWFDGLGNCRCGKKATGVLRGTRNQSFGPYCGRCAEARIKKAEKERKRAPPHPAAVALHKIANRSKEGCLARDIPGATCLYPECDC